MAVQDALLIVEGPQDAIAIGRLLRAVAFTRVTDAEILPEDWRNLVSSQYPIKGRGIDEAHQVPHFYKSDENTLVALVLSGGDSKLASSLRAACKALGRVPAAVGFVLDDDREPDPAKRHRELLALVTGLEFPTSPGVVLSGPPRAGVFIMPDNKQQGTLEDVLLESGRVAYAAQISAASEFVETMNVAGLDSDDLHARNRPAGRKKQIIGTVAAILKPGRALATTLQDNRWLKGDALHTPLVHGLRVWLHELLDLPTP